MANEVEVLDEATDAQLPAVVGLEDRLAIAGISADTLSKYLYRFTDNRGQEVAEVSADGIAHIATSAGVSIEDCDILSEDDTAITVKAIAVNAEGIRNIGIVRELKKNKKGYDNPYALQNAVRKAQRNARKGLLPMTWIRDLIHEATGGIPAAEELEGRLENAKDVYREQQAEIDRLKAVIASYDAKSLD